MWKWTHIKLIQPTVAKLDIPVMAAVAVRKKVVKVVHFSPCFCLSSLQLFSLLDPIKSNIMYWLHWKSEKKRTEPKELDELKYLKSLNQTTSYAYRHALHAKIKTFIHLFIYRFWNQKKEQAKWAKRARILKNNLTDEQLCSLICFLIFACLNIYQYICSFITFEIRKKRLS